MKVKAMGYEPLDDFMRRGLHGAAADPGNHPELEVLLAFQAGELPGATYRQVSEHIAACGPCRQCVQDLAAIPELESENHPRTEADLDADWADLMERLRREGVQIPEAAPASPAAASGTPLFAGVRRAVRAFAAFRVPLPVVATLALAALGLLAWQREAARRPSRNPHLADLATSDTRRGAETGSEWQRVDVPAASERLILLFLRSNQDAVSAPDGTPAAVTPGHRYRIELSPEAAPGRVILITPGLHADKYGTLNLDLLRDTLTAGRYFARVFEEEGSAAIAEYRFDLSFE